MVKFLHIAFDSIFLDNTIEQFEACIPGGNKYLIDIPDDSYKIRFVKNSERLTLQVLSKYNNRRSLINEFKSYNAIIFHCLNTNMIEMINNAQADTIFIWVLWGGEVNELPKIVIHLYQPLTKSLLKNLKQGSLINQLFNKLPFIKFFLYKIRHRRNHPLINKIKALSRINHVAHYLEDEVDNINTLYKLRLNWIAYIYGSVENMIGNEFFNSYTSGNEILVGNSSDPLNNHLDTFKILMKEGIISRKIICPLSYGTDKSEYIQEVIKNGRMFFKENFIPLTEFNSKKDFNNILLGCNIAVMNHNCQQATGNIIILLWFGAKVFLNESNPLLSYFKNMGIKIFSLQFDFNFECKKGLTTLSKSEIEFNRCILYKHFSKEMSILRVKRIVDKFSPNQNE